MMHLHRAKKGPPPCEKRAFRILTGRGAKLLGLFFLGFGDGRSGLVDEFHVGHRGVVADAEAHLQDAGVTTLTGGKAGTEFAEELDDGFAVAKTGEGETLVGKGGFLGERDHRFDDAAKFLGLGESRLDGFVLDEGDHHVAEHGETMGARTIELAETVTVTHD